MRRAAWLAPAALAVIVTAGPLLAQGKFPPDSLTNLQVIPQGTTVQQVLNMMRGFTGALGVRCQYCHVGQEGAPLNTFDFASDEKRTKEAARIMIEMVTEVNAKYLSQVSDRPTPTLEVRCAMCHRGVARPVALADLVSSTASAAGLDSAVKTYKALRDRYYGRAAYDFGEQSLADAAASLLRGSKPDEALGLLKLNEEQFPKSAGVQNQLGEWYRQRGDTANAIARYKMALERDPNDQQAQGRIRQLGAKP